MVKKKSDPRAGGNQARELPGWGARVAATPPNRESNERVRSRISRGLNADRPVPQTGHARHLA